MTAVHTAGVERTTARAALGVPGVAELHPSLRQSLAEAATRVRRTLGSVAPSLEAGIHAERAPRTGAWHVEARCVLDEDRRALDTARDVRESVRSAVDAYATRHGIPGPVTVVVTVTRTTGHRPSHQTGTTAP
ncbi:hypothetical protein SSPO_049240 [Streptomyces antimycoticus]|uniref:Asp23/Gls24 family envelope stress response protein n=1 Tax=Streptomyces antimycoticus TaxID=68175 RepID=A0A499V199_9ACTN|nr:hypothetical protein [Streptomyces antimycoticus]BBJ42206.1 hypothetical protein SSPO_049240 [Streptomyces antimycoticus]